MTQWTKTGRTKHQNEDRSREQHVARELSEDELRVVQGGRGIGTTPSTEDWIGTTSLSLRTAPVVRT